MRKSFILTGGFALAAAGIGTVAMSAVEQTAPQADVPALETVINVLTPASSAPTSESVNDVYYMSRYEWELPDAHVIVNTGATTPVELKRDGVTIATLAPSKIYYEPGMQFGDIALPGMCTFTFADPTTETDMSAYNTTGKYELVIPEGTFSYMSNGDTEYAAMSALTLAYDYTNEEGGGTTTPELPELDYTLNPSPDAPATSLEEIVLKFDKAGELDYSDEFKAVLESEDGSFRCVCKWPKNNFKDELILTFDGYDEKNVKQEWKSGVYTLTIEKGTVGTLSSWDPTSDPKGGNFQGLEVKYTLDFVAPTEYKFADHCQLELPNSLEANPINTKNSFGGYGMRVIGLNLDTNDMTAVDNCEWIYMEYKATEDGEVTYLPAINPHDEQALAFLTPGLMVEEGVEDDGNGSDDLLEFEAKTTMYLLFPINDEVTEETYCKPGYYTLVIPDDAFQVDGHLLQGERITFVYTDQIPEVKVDYTLTPASGETLESVAAFDKEGIAVKFNNVSSIDYKGKGGGELTGPLGKVVAITPNIDYNNHVITYKFGYPQTSSNPTKWTNGQYTFKVLPGYVMVDAGLFEDDEEGNFEGLEATYILADDTVSVALIGTDAADSYDVYTLDGKTVMLGVAPEEMSTLENGVYVINGKKVVVRK